MLRSSSWLLIICLFAVGLAPTLEAGSTRGKELKGIPVDQEYWLSILAKPVGSTPLDELPRLEVAVPVKWDELPEIRDIPGEDRVMALLFSPRTVSMKITAQGNVKIEEMFRRDEGLAVVLAKVLARWKFSAARRGGKSCAATFEASVTLVWRQNLEGKDSLPLFAIEAQYPGEYLKVKQKAPGPSYWAGRSYLPPEIVDEYFGRITGTVDMSLEVDPKGFVVRADIFKSRSPIFEAPAMAAVFSRRYLQRDSGTGLAKINSVMKFGRGFKDDPKMKFPILSPASNADRFNDAVLSHASPPIFPRVVPASVKEGTATASIHTDEKGRVTKVEICDASLPEFGHALRAALEASVFYPVHSDGIAVPALIQRSEKFRRANPLEESLVMVLDAEDRSVVKVDELDKPLSITVSQPAVFPRELIGRQQSGEAVVEFIINRNGFVREPVIVSATEPMFGYAAVQAVSGWGYAPPHKNGQDVSVKTRVKISFTPPPAASSGS